MKTLRYSRFWAEKMGRDPVSKPQSLVMAGGSSTFEEMVREIKRGVLVTRFWYVNFVDPRTLLLTGLTRDGNFLIKNGSIAGPVRNFRFNESLASVLVCVPDQDRQRDHRSALVESALLWAASGRCGASEPWEARWVNRTRRRDGLPKRRAVRFTPENRRRKASSRPSTRSMHSGKPAPPSCENCWASAESKSPNSGPCRF